LAAASLQGQLLQYTSKRIRIQPGATFPEAGKYGTMLAAVPEKLNDGGTL
jgi:hypothetical protein